MTAPSIASVYFIGRLSAAPCRSWLVFGSSKRIEVKAPLANSSTSRHRASRMRARIPPGDHFEQPFLSVQQHLGPPAVRDIHVRADDFNKLSTCAAGRMA